MDTRSKVLLGNEAIARGLIEGGCEIVTSYPGTPSSEVLPAVITFREETGRIPSVEWSLNEMIAFQVALGASITGKRSAVIMKQVGLNVAADALLSSAYTGCKGGFVIISADDPGPNSSQTEQDTRFFAMFSKVPVLDPATPLEALLYTKKAFEISEKFEIPVILRPSLRVCHARQDILLHDDFVSEKPAHFQKDPHRWAATPKYRYDLHKQLNKKLTGLAVSSGDDPRLIWEEAGKGSVGIIAGGVLRGMVKDFAAKHHLKIPILHVGIPFPLPDHVVKKFMERFEKVLILEETSPVIEMQIRDKSKVYGRLDGAVPNEGEINGNGLQDILKTFLDFSEAKPITVPTDLVQGSRRPSLCPGCPHRSSFYAIRKALPKGIYASDIGCYTLGVNLGAVDTVLVMGASIGLAMGIKQSYQKDGEEIPVIATIGDSTFLHSGLPQLANAVYNDHRIIVMILDNSVTAMTGMQPAVSSGITADGSQGNPVSLEESVNGCGVQFIRIVDPYDLEKTKAAIKEADTYTRKTDGGTAVIIARHACVIYDRKAALPEKIPVRVDVEKCQGCMACIKSFECPAIVQDGEKVKIDRRVCVECGQCIPVCPFDAFIPIGEEEDNA